MSTTTTLLNTVENQKPLTSKKEPEKHPMQNKRSVANNFPKKKHDFKGCRKRSQSFSGNCFTYKRRKKESTLPSKFLLGGNICDPLNLNSLQDEEINRAMNAVTPKSSPLPTPPRRKAQIEVIIPPNICDPLNLIDYTDDATYEKQLSSPIKKSRKKSNRKNKRTSSTCVAESTDNNNSNTTTTSTAIASAGAGTTTSEGEVLNKLSTEPTQTETTETVKDVATVTTETANTQENVTRNLSLELGTIDKEKKEKCNKRKSTDEGKEVKKVRRVDSMDKIVSPVIPQPGAWKRPNFKLACNNKPNNRTNNQSVPEKMPTFREKSKQYQYGNYNRYYGYRNSHYDVDLRLKCFAAHRGMFHGKDVLDIGCNIGHITLCIARDFGAKSVVGLDIDKKLINIARKNLRYYVNCSSEDPNGEGIPQSVNKRGKKCTEKFFPISMPILYGPVDIPGMCKSKGEKEKGFPHNVTFVQGNYVLEDESLLNLETPQFDIILALSITKWLHLNWGDTGLKQAFRRMYAQLRPGGRLILEPQAWSSYVKKKNLTETIYKNYKSIEFFPQQFTQYLLSSEVGFAKSEVMGCPRHHSKGFQRPIFVFTKSNLSPLYSQRSATSTPSYSLIAGNFAKRVYTNLQSPSDNETFVDDSLKTDKQSSDGDQTATQQTVNQPDTTSARPVASSSNETREECTSIADVNCAGSTITDNSGTDKKDIQTDNSSTELNVTPTNSANNKIDDSSKSTYSNDENNSHNVMQVDESQCETSLNKKP